jgi:hypothetical protein
LRRFFFAFQAFCLEKAVFGLGLRGIGLETDKSDAVRFSKSCAF